MNISNINFAVLGPWHDPFFVILYAGRRELVAFDLFDRRWRREFYLQVHLLQILVWVFVPLEHLIRTGNENVLRVCGTYSIEVGVSLPTQNSAVLVIHFIRRRDCVQQLASQTNDCLWLVPIYGLNFVWQALVPLHHLVVVHYLYHEHFSTLHWGYNDSIVKIALTKLNLANGFVFFKKANYFDSWKGL